LFTGGGILLKSKCEEGKQMGSVIFVILRLSGLIDTRNDWATLCMLISIDTIGIPTLIKSLRKS
jgi:hypothetical protein